MDEWAEVWDLLKPYADGSFWQMPDLDPANIYIVGRVLLKENWTQITQWATEHPGRIVFCNPAEGSQTILLQLRRLRIADHVRDGRILLLTSGDLEPGWDYCKTDCYFSNIVEYTENKAAQLQAALDYKHYRPYEFLFLNGRLRPHRKWLIDGLRNEGFLDHALWTNLGSQVELGFTSALNPEPTEPIRLLPAHYEIPRAVPNLDKEYSGFAKHELFDNTWGDAIVNHHAYTDTWFSVVTETIFDYPYTFRTEKIYKPILMAHPFVVAANRGYLKDLRAAGFKTFGHLIDEHYDQIDCPSTRIDRIIDTIRGISLHNGAAHFWEASRDICKYNQQHLVEHNQKERAELPDNLERYLNDRLGI